MKPLIGAKSISRWLLRLFPAFFIFNNHLETLLNFDFSDVIYLIILALGLFSLLLILGGFFRKQSLTIVSGLIISILSLIMLFLNFENTIIVSFSVILILLGFFFVANGNNKKQ
ncbi:MAG: hypothetical protein JXR68_00775 [Bacteroidales bacterium]|nr:hypothetical protein [Bacteroidales bacterium]